MTDTSAAKLRVACVGCGPRAQAHLAAMRESGAAELIAACDADDARRTSAATHFGVSRTYSDLADMVRAERPELLDIVTPPDGRVALVEAAVDAGARAILIEKPIALRPSEARQLRELGREAFIAVNTQYQWMPHWRRFWTVLRDRELGEIRTIHCGSRTNLLEQGPHTLDLALRVAAISGLPEPEWVMASAAGLAHMGTAAVPSDVSATFGLGEARLFLNHGPGAPAVPGEEVYWYHIALDVIGTRGRLVVTLNKGWQLWRRGRDGTVTFESGDTAWPRDDHLAQTSMFTELRQRLRDGTAAAEFPTRVEVAARNADLMFACYASALGGGRVALPVSLPDTVVEKLDAALANPPDFSKSDRTRERPRRMPPADGRGAL